MNRALKQYHRDIRHLLPGTAKQKKQLMDTLWQSIAAYVEDNPDATVQEVQAHFGTPQQIATAYLDEMSTSEVIKKIKTRKIVISIICIAIVLALLMWGLGVLKALSKEQHSADGYYDIGEIIVEEMEENK